MFSEWTRNERTTKGANKTERGKESKRKVWINLISVFSYSWISFHVARVIQSNHIFFLSKDRRCEEKRRKINKSKQLEVQERKKKCNLHIRLIAQQPKSIDAQCSRYNVTAFKWVSYLCDAIEKNLFSMLIESEEFTVAICHLWMSKFDLWDLLWDNFHFILFFLVSMGETCVSNDSNATIDDQKQMEVFLFDWSVKCRLLVLFHSFVGKKWRFTRTPK